MALRVRVPRIPGVAGGGISGTASGDLPLGGSAAGVVVIAGVASGDLPLSGSAAGTVAIAGVAAGDLPLAGAATGIVGSLPPPVEPPKRRRGGFVYWDPRPEREEPQPQELPEVAPPVIVAKPAPIVPNAALPARKPQVAARSLADLGRVLGMDAAALERARIQAEMDAEEEELLLLL